MKYGYGHKKWYEPVNRLRKGALKPHSHHFFKKLRMCYHHTKFDVHHI